MRSQTPRVLHSLALAALCAFPLLQAGTALAAPVPSQAQGEAVDPPGRVGRIGERHRHAGHGLAPAGQSG